MFRFSSSIALIAFQILSACSSENSLALNHLPLHSKNECELVFKSQNALVIENFCNTEQEPVLIKLAGQAIRSSWIDEKTSRFLFQEGCAKADECFYELSTEGAGVRGRFSYRINLTEGEYSFEVDESGQPKLLFESSKDIAS